MKYPRRILPVLACVALISVVMGCAKLNPATEGHIHSALEAKNAEFESCYEKALEKDRDLKGTVNLALKFDPKGTQPESVEVVNSGIKDAAMLSCVSKAASTIQIEDVPGVNVEGQYTVSFQHR